jgi:hypothetical protein
VLRASVAWVWGPVVVVAAGLTGLPAVPLAIATGVAVAVVLVRGALRQRSALLRDVHAAGAALRHAVDAVLAAPHAPAPSAHLERLCALVEDAHGDVVALADAHARRARAAVGAACWSEALHRAAAGGHVARARATLTSLDPVHELGPRRRAALAAAAPAASARLEGLATLAARDTERIVVVAIALRHAQIALARRPWAVRPYSTAVRLDRELLRASRLGAARLAGATAALGA